MISEIEIQKTLETVLPSKTVIRITKNEKLFSNGHELAIVFYPESNTINGVRGQYPQIVSLNLDLDTLELKPQIYGGNGGQCIYKIPEENSYLAMQRIKIPFRKPKPEKDKILAAIKRFAQRWLEAIKENKDNLMYQEYVNYDDFLKS